MTQMLLELPAAPCTGVTHICLPDFSLACGIGFIDKPEGDRVIFGWGQTAPTCVWCRSLGRAYSEHVGHQMQGRQVA